MNNHFVEYLESAIDKAEQAVATSLIIPIQKLTKR